MTTYAFSQILELSKDVLAQSKYIDDSDVVYPTEDGTPMAESDLQLIWLIYFVQALKSHFEKVQDIYTAGDMFIYFEKGEPSAVVAPDVFVVKGVENKIRESFKVWEEGKGPDFVIEITSKSTAIKDQTEKLGTYAFLGVKEYMLFDPSKEYLDHPLKFYRWSDFGFVSTEPLVQSDGTEIYESDMLNLEFHHLNGKVKIYDPAADQFIRHYSEERQAKEAAERRIKELEAEIARLKNKYNNDN